jgi:hypothetical protein
MANYAGLSPQDALAAWYAQRNPNDQRTFDMTELAQQNPAAWQLLKTGQNDNGQTRQIFNTNTGQWDNQQDQGFFSHPESWLQLAFGAGMGGLGAAAGLGGGAGGAASGSGGAAGATSAALGTAPAAELGIPTTSGLATGAGVGTSVGAPSMADLSGLVAGGGLWADTGAASLLTGPYSPLLKALAGVGGLIGGKALGNMGQANAVPPQLSQLLDLAMQRANAQTPMFNAANAGQYAMLPDFAKKGGG